MRRCCSSLRRKTQAAPSATPKRKGSGFNSGDSLMERGLLFIDSLLRSPPSQDAHNMITLLDAESTICSSLSCRGRQRRFPARRPPRLRMRVAAPITFLPSLAYGWKRLSGLEGQLRRRARLAEPSVFSPIRYRPANERPAAEARHSSSEPIARESLRTRRSAPPACSAR